MIKHIFLIQLLLFASFSKLFSQENPDILKHPKIGLVLSGGGAKGFAHIGVLKIIDELGIPIDYISGTSMGSIIGGFYAMGYSAKEIEQIVLAQNWNEILSDNVSRKYLSINDKADFERYAFSFPLKTKGIQLPKGIVKGQNVIKLFESLSVNHHNYNDFSKLPIPFLCMAADIETGEAVILDSGYLPEAMRASMAIPTFFSPLCINDKLLVDGGMVNNFPVQELLNKGMDIIIGVNVLTGPKSKAELNSFVDIINQTVSLMAVKNLKENIDKVDILIKPDVKNYKVGSFHHADSLIKKGEEAARKFIPKLKQLKQNYSLSKLSKKHFKIPNDSTSFYVNKINVEGLQNIRQSIITSKLTFSTPGKVSLSDIKNGIDRIYASQYFDLVDFKLLGKDTKTLLIRVKERNTKKLNIGIHYDSDNEAGILLNTTFLNVLKDGSRLSMDAKLADLPKAKLSYSIDNGLKPGIKFSSRFINSDVDAFFDGRKIGRYTFDYFELDINVNSILRNSYSIGFGARFEHFNIKSNYIAPELLLKDKDYFYSYYAFMNIDNHEKLYYPKSGVSFYGEFKMVSNNGIRLNKANQPLYVAYFKAKKAVSLNSNFTLYPQFYGRFLWGNSIPNLFDSYIGGSEKTDYFDIQVPFVGLERMEVATKNVAVIRADLQYKLFKNNYLILKTNFGRFFENNKNRSNKASWIKGIGLSYSYNSFIGPMEISLMYSDKKDRVFNYVNLGYWF